MFGHAGVTMSYDLFFKPRTKEILSAEFEQYFSSNPLYEFEFPQAWYKNEDTGVYFLFEWQEPAEVEDDEMREFVVALNINYFRPSFFVLEAEIEVTKFVRHFDLLVSDPQIQGMGDGEYDASKLISGWNEGNEFGYASILRDPASQEGVIGITTQKLVDSWRWNFEKTQIQAVFGESKFVPRIIYLLLDSKPVTAAVWPDGIPIVVPKVDYFIIPRSELAPRIFFRRVEDQTIATYSEVMGLFERNKENRPDSLLVLNYEHPPESIKVFVGQLPRMEPTWKFIALDSALNKELVDKYAV
jgi:hypothetical protein